MKRLHSLYLLPACIAAAAGFSILGACSNNRIAEAQFDSLRPEDVGAAEFIAATPAPWEEEIENKARMQAHAPLTETPLPSGRIRVRNLGRLWEVFNDSNYRQYEYAEALGIEPITSVRDAYHTRRPVIRIESNDLYTVDSLTHSMPYLVPEAARLLADIGRGFRDSLKARGGSPHKIRVTSLLRTPYTVKRLRRVNRNATDSSTHQFATTFDISYARFDCADTTRPIHDGDLKNLLAEVLFDLRDRGRCLVKYERKSPCFHITATR